MPPNLSAQIVCPNPKVWDFDEKRLHWASVVVRGLNGPGLHYILLKWLIVQNTHSLLIQYPSLGLILFEPSSLRCILDKETIYAGDKE